MSTMTKPSKRPGRPPKFKRPEQSVASGKSGRSGRTINVTFSPDAFATLQSFLDSFEFKPNRSEVIEGFVLAALKQRGFPKDAP